MWKLWIWPAFCVFLLGYNYGGFQLLLAHAEQCDEIGCAFASFGPSLLQAVLFDSLILYALFVAGLLVYSKRKKKPVDYWIPFIFGPFSFVFACILEMTIANLF